MQNNSKLKLHQYVKTEGKLLNHKLSEDLYQKLLKQYMIMDT